MAGIRVAGNVGEVIITNSRFDGLDLAIDIDIEGDRHVRIERTVVTNSDAAFRVSCEGDVFGSNNVYMREASPGIVFNNSDVDSDARLPGAGMQTRLAAAIRRASNGDVGN